MKRKLLPTIPLESSFRIAQNWPKFGKIIMTSEFSDITPSSNFLSRCFVFLVKFSYWSKFHVSFITDSGVMTIFLYKRYTPLEIRSSEFCSISGDWGKLGILNLPWIFLIKFYWMLQNARVTAFIIFELLRENQPPSQIRVKIFNQLLGNARYTIN